MTETVEKTVDGTVKAAQSAWSIVLSIVTSEKFYVPVICLVVAIVLTKLTKKAVNRFFMKNDLKSLDVKRKATIVGLVQKVVKYLIWIFCTISAVSAFGVNVTGLITGVGVVGVVAGLALQDALKDIIAGCNIILDNFYVLGDKIEVNGFTGDVIEFSLKNTKIKSVNGEVLVIANREISCIKNLSMQQASIGVTIPTAYEEKSEKVVKVLNKICKKIDDFEITTKETEMCGLDALSASSVDYLIRAYCKAGDQWALKRQILALVKDEFDKEGVKIPYNQIEVHNE